MPRTDPALVDKAVQEYIDGKTGRTVAREAGIAESVLYRALKARGINAMALQRRGERGHANRRFSDTTEGEIGELYQNGKSLATLGKAYGVDLATIRNVLKRCGIERRRRGNELRAFEAVAVEEMNRMWQEGRSQSAIAERFGTAQTVISRVLAMHGHKKETRHARGERHGNWKGGRWKFGNYVMVRIPQDSPFASMRNTQGYVFEHRLVMAQALGRPLLASETVHHINDNGADNRLENLQLRHGKHGHGRVLVCLDCGSHNISAARLHPSQEVSP